MEGTFTSLEVMVASSQARVFNETPINPRKCAHILTKILYLINQVPRLSREYRGGCVDGDVPYAFDSSVIGSSSLVLGSLKFPALICFLCSSTCMF